jgi:TM2 domain-containing membrane protein YozV
MRLNHPYSYRYLVIKKRKIYLTNVLLCFFLGLLGAHRFYNKQCKTGCLMLVTLGGVGIWYLYDLITLLMGKYKGEKGARISF